MEVVHIAGVPITIASRTAGTLVRQLCGWCGYELVDVDTSLMAVPVGQEGPPATWETGALVAVCGPASYVVEYRDGDDLPDASCTFGHRAP
jgi:hypothetical protein